MSTPWRYIEHRAQPGPMYWDWRCLRCSERCDRHLGFWALLLLRWRRR